MEKRVIKKKQTLGTKRVIVQKLEALEAGTLNTSIRKIAKEHNIEPSTVRYIRKHKDAIKKHIDEHAGNPNIKNLILDPTKSARNDALMATVKKARAGDGNLHEVDLITTATKFEISKTGHEDSAPSTGMLQRFKNRYAVKCKVRCGAALPVDPQVVENFRNEIQK
jgi:hypothetical protein